MQLPVERLLAEIEIAWSQNAWCRVADLATDALRQDPSNKAAEAYLKVAQTRARREFDQLTRAVNGLPVLAFLTDSLNRIQWVNRTFAATVGDPIERCLPVEERFLPAMIAGPFRDRFPRWQQELSSCLSGLHREIEAGHLAPGTLRLIDDTLLLQDALRKGLENCDDWDGTMLVRSSDGQLKLVREHVLPLVDGTGRNTGLHLTQWFEVDQPAAERGTCDVSPAKLLTPRQLEIGRLYASGLTSEEVAVAAGISRRTARDHIEEIYSRLGVHSRSELTLHFARAGLV